MKQIQVREVGGPLFAFFGEGMLHTGLAAVDMEGAL